MATLNPNISNIPKDSPVEALYNRLLSGLTEASQITLPDFTGPDYVSPDGIVNVNKINLEINSHSDICRKNAAYMFANSIVTSLGVGGQGGIGGAVSITGDSMTGKLYTLYGFEAGENGIKIFGVSQIKGETPDKDRNIVNIDGELHLNRNGIFINNDNVIKYDARILSLDSPTIALNGNVTCSGAISIDKLNINKDGITIGNDVYYHSGNSNLNTVDWNMKNANIANNLHVVGTSIFDNTVTAQNGVSLGFGGKSILSIDTDNLANLNGDLNIIGGGVKFDNDYIIHIKNLNTVSFSASNKVLNLGDDNTIKITLQTGVYDNDGEYELIGKYGSAYFPQSFKAGHGLGNTLMSTYKVSMENAGVIFHRYLRFKDTEGPAFTSDGTRVLFEGPFRYNTNIGDQTIPTAELQSSSFGYIESTSLFAPLNRPSSSFSFNTDADFYVFDKPVEGATSIGITGSKTRILDNQLFFRDGNYLLAIKDGIKHYGNAYMTGSIGSVEFSSGFAGNGWKIYKNKLTGNISATFDELTVRKKFRVYELEVQKTSSTNGSLWVSDSCSGDTVEEIL